MHLHGHQPGSSSLQTARSSSGPVHYTPKHGSWLNMAEIELSVLKGQCLDRRIPDMSTMQAEVTTWETARNNSANKIDWQFTTSDARIKLKRLYPKL